MDGPQFEPINKKMPWAALAKCDEERIFEAVQVGMAGIVPISLAKYPASLKLRNFEFPLDLGQQIRNNQIIDVTGDVPGTAE